MKILTLKKSRLLFLFAAFLLSVSASYAQKSIYDVIPGSGPKKTQTDKRRGTGLPGIIYGENNRRDNRTVYSRKRRNLPPGQAKKIYGGEATDYAPGQVKKHGRGKEWDRDENHEGHNGRGNHGKHHDED